MTEEKQAPSGQQAPQGRHIKIYDLITKEDGSVRFETELSAEDMKSLLEFAFVTMLAYGFTVSSLAHHFPTREEQQKNLLEQLPPENLHKA